MAYTQLEGTIRRAARSHGIEDAGRATVTQLLRGLEVPMEISDAVRNLSQLRNEVTHSNARPSAGEATEYVDAARSVDKFVRGDSVGAGW
jgi:hypothetical protein